MTKQFVREYSVGLSYKVHPLAINILPVLQLIIVNTKGRCYTPKDFTVIVSETYNRVFVVDASDEITNMDEAYGLSLIHI